MINWSVVDYLNNRPSVLEKMALGSQPDKLNLQFISHITVQTESTALQEGTELILWEVTGWGNTWTYAIWRASFVKLTAHEIVVGVSKHYGLWEQESHLYFVLRSDQTFF